MRCNKYQKYSFHGISETIAKQTRFLSRAMFTVTTKQILSPLADAVSQLIVIVSECEINNSAMPDLTSLAKNVSENIGNLVNIALHIQSQPNADEQVKDEMPKACNEGRYHFILTISL